MDDKCTNCGAPLNLEVLPCLACGWEPADAETRNALAFKKNELRMAKAKNIAEPEHCEEEEEK